MSGLNSVLYNEIASKLSDQEREMFIDTFNGLEGWPFLQLDLILIVNKLLKDVSLAEFFETVKEMDKYTLYFYFNLLRSEVIELETTAQDEYIISQKNEKILQLLSIFLCNTEVCESFFLTLKCERLSRDFLYIAYLIKNDRDNLFQFISACSLWNRGLAYEKILSIIMITEIFAKDKETLSSFLREVNSNWNSINELAEYIVAVSPFQDGPDYIKRAICCSKV